MVLLGQTDKSNKYLHIIAAIATQVRQILTHNYDNSCYSNTSQTNTYT